MTDSAVVLLDVGGTFVKGGLADSAGHLYDGVCWQVPMDSEGTAEDILLSLEHSLRRGISESKALGMKAAGLAATFPGPFDYFKGIPLMEHKFRSVYGLNLKDWIRGLQGIPPDFKVSFVHDVIAQLLGEMSRGAAVGFANVCIITLGTGLGFACSIDGEIRLSPTASPAESIYSLPYGDGILEDYVSKRGFIRIYRELCSKDEPGLTVKEIGRRAGEGEKAALDTFTSAASILSANVRPILEKNRTECLLLGGQISRSYRFMEGALKRGLSSVPGLKVISPVSDIDKAALYGSFAAFAKEIYITVRH